jgi:small-conductance mechanosensitive channel
MPRYGTFKKGNLLLTVLLLTLVPSWSQTEPNSSPASGDNIVRFLNQTVVWYRQLTAEQNLVSEDSDLLFWNDHRQIADQVVRLSFDFARARAQVLSGYEGAAPTDAAASSSSQYQRLSELAAKAEQQVKQSQQEIDGLRQRLDSVTGSKRRTLQATIAETESELELFQARRDALRGMLQVSTGNAAGGRSAGSLSAQIEELARTLPAVETAKEQGTASNSTSVSPSASVASAPQEHRARPAGIPALISDLFSLRHKIGVLDDNLKSTDSLANSARVFRAPLAAKMRELTQKGDQLAAQPDSADPAVLTQERNDLDALTAQYKLLSASVLPLGRQAILLDVYKGNAANWRNALESQYESELKALLLHLAGLAALVGVVLAISELGRRATFRYVKDARRRSQLMLMRRIVLWCLVAIIVGMAFASELGAITTFAGLLTVGITVALQNVILSVAGYFFLIGKYGVRVGDRLQIAGVTGDVVDVGMVRLHLMEVTSGTSPRPTGRVVVFSNSVVFQANAGMFKQIPGTKFLWHEVTLTLGPESDYREVEQRMLDAVNKVCSEYRENMEMQRRTMERALYSVGNSSFAPESRLRLVPSGLEVVIRYPVELDSAAEIDDRITRELLEAIGDDPKLRLVGGQIQTQAA